MTAACRSEEERPRHARIVAEPPEDARCYYVIDDAISAGLEEVMVVIESVSSLLSEDTEGGMNRQSMFSFLNLIHRRIGDLVAPRNLGHVWIDPVLVQRGFP